MSQEESVKGGMGAGRGLLLLGLVLALIVAGFGYQRHLVAQSERESARLAALEEKPEVQALNEREREWILDQAVLVLGGGPLVEEEAEEVVSGGEAVELEKDKDDNIGAPQIRESTVETALSNRSIPYASHAIQAGNVVSPYPPYNVLNVAGLESGSVAADPTTIPLDPETGKPRANVYGMPDLIQAKWFRVP